MVQVEGRVGSRALRDLAEQDLVEAVRVGGGLGAVPVHVADHVGRVGREVAPLLVRPLEDPVAELLRFELGDFLIADSFAGKIVKLDLARNMAIFSNEIELPLAPFMGVMAVAPPPETKRVSSRPPAAKPRWISARAPAPISSRACARATGGRPSRSRITFRVPMRSPAVSARVPSRSNTTIGELCAFIGAEFQGEVDAIVVKGQLPGGNR